MLDPQLGSIYQKEGLSLCLLDDFLGRKFKAGFAAPNCCTLIIT